MTSVQDAVLNNKTVNGNEEHAGESLDEPNRQTLKTEDPTRTFTSGDVTLKDDTTNDVSPIVITPTDVSENDVIPPSSTLTPQTPDGSGDAVVKRKRGRPPKQKSSENQPICPVIRAVVQESVSSPTGDSAVKRKRGRPPKRPLEATDHHSGVVSTEGESDNMSSCEMTPPVKRGRGRPRKSESQKVKYKEVLSLSSMSSPQRTGERSAVGGPHGTPSSEARISRRLAVKRESGYVAPWKSLMKSPKEEDDDETESVEKRKRGRPRLDSNTPIRKIVQPKKSTGSQMTGDVISKDARRIHSIMKTQPVDTTEEGKNTKAFGQTVACVSKAVVDKLTTDHHLPRLFNQLTTTLGISWFSSEDLTYYLHGDINALCQAQQVLDKICEGQTLADSCASLNISFVETVDEAQEDVKEDDNGEVEAEGAEMRGPESEDSQTDDPVQTTDHEDHEYAPPQDETDMEIRLSDKLDSGIAAIFKRLETVSKQTEGIHTRLNGIENTMERVEKMTATNENKINELYCGKFGSGDKMYDRAPSVGESLAVKDEKESREVFMDKTETTHMAGQYNLDDLNETAQHKPVLMIAPQDVLEKTHKDEVSPGPQKTATSEVDPQKIATNGVNPQKIAANEVDLPDPQQTATIEVNPDPQKTATSEVNPQDPKETATNGVKTPDPEQTATSQMRLC